MQAAGASIAAAAKALKARTAAVAFMGLPGLSDADKVPIKRMSLAWKISNRHVAAAPLFFAVSSLAASQTNSVSAAGRRRGQAGGGRADRRVHTAACLTHPVSWLQAAAAGKLAAGVLTGAYEATRFKAKPTLSTLESLAVLTPGDAGAAEAAIATAAGLAAGTMLTRCWLL